VGVRGSPQLIEAHARPMFSSQIGEIDVRLKCALFAFYLALLPITVMRELLDVVNQAEELPLTIDLVSSSQREAI
jgi:hypothetical protein